jgi:hypothetical protein
VSFSTNDVDENPFNFSVSGTVVNPPQVLIIDNGDAGFGTVGEWSPYANQGYQADIHYSAAGTGADLATWTFSNLTPGQYRVSASWHPQGNRATNSPFTIWDGVTQVGGVAINQELAPNDFSDAGVSWEDLGGPHTIAGNTLIVKLSDLANEYVIADAIRIERLGPASLSDSGGFEANGERLRSAAGMAGSVVPNHSTSAFPSPRAVDQLFATSDILGLLRPTRFAWDRR